MHPFLLVILLLGGQNATTPFEELLAKGDDRAVALVQGQGANIVSVLQRFSTHSDYHVRRVVVSCAAQLANDGGGPILAAGLSDQNINVRLTAAHALADRGHPSAKAAVIEQLQKADSEVREILVLAAGNFPGEDTIKALQPLSIGKDRIAGLARASLARLGDKSAKAELNRGLSSSSPRERYETLEFIQRTGDRTFVPAIAKLVSDRAQALRIGSVNNPRYRRVCDQAVDSAISLLGIKLSFMTGPERIYSAGELNEAQGAISR